MIGIREEPLPIAKLNALHRWLAQPEAETLLQLAESEMKRHAATAANAAIEMSKYDAQVAVLEDAVRASARYRIFIEVFRELANHPQPKLVLLS